MTKIYPIKAKTHHIITALNVTQIMPELLELFELSEFSENCTFRAGKIVQNRTFWKRFHE